MDERESSERDPQTFAIIGAAIEVHRVLGPGFLEAVYQEAMGVEMAAREIPLAREAPLCVNYKGQTLACSYRADFVCYENVLLELKALAALTSLETAIAINYLKATGFERCLLLNFGAARLEYKRVVLSKSNLSADDADFRR